MWSSQQGHLHVHSFPSCSHLESSPVESGEALARLCNQVGHWAPHRTFYTTQSQMQELRSIEEIWFNRWVLASDPCCPKWPMWPWTSSLPSLCPNPTVRGEQCPCTSTSKCYGDKRIRDSEEFIEDNMTYQDANSVAINRYYYWCQNLILFLIFVLEHYFEPQPGNILPRITHISQSNYAWKHQHC